MKLSEVGEFGLVELIAGTINKSRDNNAISWQNLLVGIGDDTAAWKCDNSIQLATVDSLAQDVHFPPGTASWEDLGWKALAINLSDIAAMGGTPTYALVYLGLPPQTEVEDVLSLYKGMLQLAGQFGVALIGGDTDNMPQMVITVTALGTGEAKHLLTRATARPGDQIAVTGYLGAAAAGYIMLSEKLTFSGEDAQYLKKSFLRPAPRITEGKLLAAQGVKTAMDISDGLISDLTHICHASGVGARLYTKQIPLPSEVTSNFSREKALEMALSGGEDYELLFTGSAEIINKVKNKAVCPVTVIGEIGSGSSVIVENDKGKPFNVRRKGWEHFISNP